MRPRDRGGFGAGAVREADRRLLDEFRREMESLTMRAPPPIVVALSHMDTVRPIQEWRPPYDIAQGQSTKERNLREAIEAVAGDLQVAAERIVPVCLRPESIYNVDESLWPLIVRTLPEGDRAKALRVLAETRSAEQWEKLKRQLTGAGLGAVQLLGSLAARRLTPRSGCDPAEGTAISTSDHGSEAPDAEKRV